MLHNKFVMSICIAYSICLLQQTPAKAQSGEASDTIRLDIKAAEKQFLDKNLTLLAQHYNVEAGKAMVQQARLWDNPILVTDQNVYSNKRWFEHGTDAAGNP